MYRSLPLTTLDSITAFEMVDARLDNDIKRKVVDFKNKSSPRKTYLSKFDKDTKRKTAIRP